MATSRKISGLNRHLSGWRKDTPDHRDLKVPIPRWKAIVAPARVDLRRNCSRIENQGDLGSCTANSATSAMEFLYKKLGKPQPELSRLFLYFATRVWIAQEDPSSDNGAMLRDVMKALTKFGTSIEGLWPYKPENFFTVPNDAAKQDALNHQILHYFRCPNLAYIKACLAQGYPAVGGFMVPASADGPETEKTGIIKYPAPNEGFVGGHAVLFVGYDDKRQMLIFQNSWGTDWGEKGFGYLPYRYVNNNLAGDFWTIRQAEM